mmetsp:Transcript_47686/g.149909  ORF Transcript_47686/g.149909 Transcript_47686/m.149909 type:complete len:277 (-) Transcript_47686:718-1548(-)
MGLGAPLPVAPLEASCPPCICPDPSTIARKSALVMGFGAASSPAAPPAALAWSCPCGSCSASLVVRKGRCTAAAFALAAAGPCGGSSAAGLGAAASASSRRRLAGPVTATPGSGPCSAAGPSPAVRFLGAAPSRAAARTGTDWPSPAPPAAGVEDFFCVMARWLLLTTTSRPPSSLSVSRRAACAPSASANSTKPNPRDLPWALRTRSTCDTSPHEAKCTRRAASSTLKARFLTWTVVGNFADCRTGSSLDILLSSHSRWFARCGMSLRGAAVWWR